MIIMTTKYKIGVGFCIMILISIAVAFIGHRGLTTATQEFQDYRRLARLNTAVSDLVAAMHSLSSNMFQYLDEHSPEALTKANADVQDITRRLTSVRSLSTSASTLDLLNSFQNELASMGTLPNLINTSLKDSENFYNKTFLPSVAKVAENLNSIQSLAFSIGNAEAHSVIIEVWDDFSRVRAIAGTFFASRSPEHALQLENTSALFSDEFT